MVVTDFPQPFPTWPYRLRRTREDTVTPELLQRGDFFVTRTEGRWYDRMMAWAIRFDTARDENGHWVDAPVNHAGIYAGVIDREPAIVEANGTVRLGSPSQYPNAVWSTGRLPSALTPTASQRSRIVTAALQMVGDKYNWLDILAIGLAQKRTGDLVDDDTWWARRLSWPGREICSQVVDKAYSQGGIQLYPGRLPGLVSPMDLYQLLTPAP